MSETLRQSAWTPPPVVVAQPWTASPSAALQSWAEGVHRQRMAGLPFINAALQVEVVGLRSLDGDWFGGLITPWSVQLVLLPGGGSLWLDIAAGTRRRVALPVGELWFLADAGEDELQAYQYCPLGTGVDGFAGQADARRFIEDALEAVLAPPPAPAAEAPAAPIDPARRTLLGLGRKRGAPADA